MTTTTRPNSKRDRMYQQIENHGRNLLAIFPNATERDPVKLCKKLRKLDREAAAIGLQLCNGPEFDSPEAVDYECDQILARVNALLCNFGPMYANSKPQVPVILNRDPRGYSLKIDDAWMNAQRADHRTAYKAALHRDWGGYGILAPEFDGN